MDTATLDDLLDALTFDAIPKGWIANFKLLLEHLEEQSRAAAVAEADKNPDIPADGEVVGDAEDVSADFLHCVFDQRHITNRPKRKWYNPNTELGDRHGSSRRTLKRGLCFHHTAVTGGFGADRSMIKRYTEQLNANGVDMDALFLKHNRTLTVEEAARALALAARYRGEPPRKYNMGVPYHAIMAANSVLYLNLPFEWVTWHGNGANTDFLGVGWDARSSVDKVKPIADDLIADAETIIKLARDAGHPIEEFTTHSVWTRKPSDPDAEFIALVMEPAAKEYGCRIDYNFKADVKGARSIRETLDAAA